MPHVEKEPDSQQRVLQYCESAFERFMERVGMLTMKLMRSHNLWLRGCGALLGGFSVCLMLPLLAYWWCSQTAQLVCGWCASVAQRTLSRVRRWFQ